MVVGCHGVYPDLVFATHLLTEGTNIRIIRERPGHKDVSTTMIYTHVLREQGIQTPKSPLDF